MFEPLIIVSNSIFLVLCILYYRRLRMFPHPYPAGMASFLLWLGISSVFGAVAHSVHYQLGTFFFNATFFLMNATSLVAMYFCFSGTYAYLARSGRREHIVRTAVIFWVVMLLLISAIYRQFLLIKIHAAIALLFTMVVHIRMHQVNGWRGNRVYLIGVGLSFASVLVHSLRISFHEWFNYKDFAHAFMIAALVVMFQGIRSLSSQLTAAPARS